MNILNVQFTKKVATRIQQLQYLRNVEFFTGFHIMQQNLLQLIQKKTNAPTTNFDVSPISTVMNFSSFGYVLSHMELYLGSKDYQLIDSCVAALKQMV